MEIKDTFNTIVAPSEETLYKEKGSKFFGYAFPIASESEVKPIIELLKKQHPHAVHYCYAYQLGTGATLSYRANDDGEPNNSAGMPIYGQIQSHGLTNILIVVVRLFGGIKLGVGGLISAYKTSAQMTLEVCEVIEKTIDAHFLITFDYVNMNKVMRVIKEKNIDIVSQDMEFDSETGKAIGKTEIKIRKKSAQMVLDTFESLFEINIKSL